jgi:hypothetical protein
VRDPSCRRFRASSEVGYLTSDTVWNLRELPKAPAGARRRPDRLRTGAGLRPFRRQVTQVEMAPRMLMREDPEVSELVTQRFIAPKGIAVLVNHKARRFVIENGEKILLAEHQGRTCAFPSTRCWSPLAVPPISQATA